MHSTEKPALTHHEAVQEVYRWTPQIRDYDRFMHIGARWVPYTMYFHEKMFRSPTINTDALGFRYTEFDGKRPIARHQRVYATLGEKMATDEVHALSMKTFTPAEWAAQQA